MTRERFPAGYAAEREHIQEGTRTRFESRWLTVADTASATVNHDLGEIPMTVSVCRSDSSSGAAPRDATADVTVTKTAESVTITNTSGSAGYFCVRAS